MNKLMHLLLIAAFASLACITNIKAGGFKDDVSDPFAQFLRSVPLVTDTLSSEIIGEGDQAIIVKEIVFNSKNYTNKVYAITAYPVGAGKFPALLIIHGGSGNASGLRQLVEKFARKGYVVMAPDMPGFCNVNHTPHTTGPWKANPEYYEPPRFNVGANAKNSTLVDAEVSGLEAFNLLCAQPNVNVSKVGITGFSWGGYSTTILSGLLGKRVKAAYSVWGSGYYDKGSFWKGIIDTLPSVTRERWLTYIDAGRRAGNIKAEYFVEGASNDTYFWPAAVSATLNAMHSPKNHVWGPNVNHTLVASSGTMQELYFDYLLKGEGKPFGQISISKIKSNNDGSKEIEIRLKAPSGIKTDTVQLYYSEHNDNWPKRTWVAINAQLKSGNKYYVTIPAAMAAKKISFYAYAVDSRKVRTSSYMYQ